MVPGDPSVCMPSSKSYSQSIKHLVSGSIGIFYSKVGPHASSPVRYNRILYDSLSASFGLEAVSAADLVQ